MIRTTHDKPGISATGPMVSVVGEPASDVGHLRPESGSVLIAQTFPLVGPRTAADINPE
jgi:hypothetical protein